MDFRHCRMHATWTLFTTSIILALCAWTGFSSSVPVPEDYQEIVVSVVWDATNQQYLILNRTVDDRIAWANFTDQIASTGWSFLKVVTNESYPDKDQAYAAGLAEGYVTTNLLYMHWMNTVEGYCKPDPDNYDDDSYCDRLYDFLDANQKWIRQKLNIFGDNDPYWHQISLLQQQLAGLNDGFQLSFPTLNASRHHNRLKDFGFLLFNVAGDLTDLEPALNKSTSTSAAVKGSGSCSALIKLLPDNADLFVAHDTWNSYGSMLRILKKYEFHYHLTATSDSPLIPGFNMTFSSYPGCIHSMDDFYTISSGLTTLETTIENNNPSLWKYVKAQSILEYARVMTANRLATSGQQWTTFFSKYNSGTYNNQWMVVDYKKFQPYQKTLKNGLLWILEQLPSMTESQDRTDTLRNQTYWPSYNSPYFETIFNLSGTPALVDQFGDWFSYDHTPRALIFRRDHSKVTDLETMRKLMRYNNFEHDSLSRCNCTPPYSAENAIAARCDLNPANGTYEFAALGHRAHGAIDSKITSSSLFQSLQFHASAGPTFDDQPPFQWTTFDQSATTPHLGHPDLWNFKPIIVQWE